MGQFFSKGTVKKEQRSKASQAKDEGVTEKDWAILDLKNARDRLKKYRKKLEVDSARLQAQAIELIKLKQRDRALLVLKLKKFKEKEVKNADGQLIQVLELIETVEWAAYNMEVMAALKVGTNMLNKMHEEMSLEDIEDLLEETHEAIEVENQINELLAGQFNIADNEELELELEELMKEDTKEDKSSATATSNEKKTKTTSPISPAEIDLDLPTVPATAVMPSVPSHVPVVDPSPSPPPPQAVEEEEDEDRTMVAS